MKNTKYVAQIVLCLGAVLFSVGCSKDNDIEKGGGGDASTVLTKEEYARMLVDVDVIHADLEGADVEVGPDGTDVTWDLSGNKKVEAKTRLTYEACPDADGCDLFPEADHIRSVENGLGMKTPGYMQLTDDAYARIGNVGTDGIVYQMEGVDVMLKFPMLYQNEFTSSFESYIPQVISESTDKTVVMDGYGTLITPAGTFPNTMRFKVTQATRLVLPPNPHGPNVQDAYVTTYIWVNKDYKAEFLAQVMLSESHIEGSPTLYNSAFSYTNPEKF